MRFWLYLMPSALCTETQACRYDLHHVNYMLQGEGSKWPVSGVAQHDIRARHSSEASHVTRQERSAHVLEKQRAGDLGSRKVQQDPGALKTS